MSRKSIIFLLFLVIFVILAFGIIRYGWFLPAGGVMPLLAQGDQNSLLPYLVVISALVDSINPCALSVLLLTIAFLFSLGRSRRRIIETGGVYIFGIFLTYVLIGLGIIQVLSILGVPHFMAKIGAAVVIIWAVVDLLGEYVPNFPIQLKIPQAAHHKIAGLIEKGTIPTAFGLGVLVGLPEFPCTGGPYLFILGLLHDQATFTAGAWYLLLYNLIFVLPLVVILLIGSDPILLSKVQEWKKANNRSFRTWMGIIMLILGLIIFQF